MPKSSVPFAWRLLLSFVFFAWLTQTSAIDLRCPCPQSMTYELWDTESVETLYSRLTRCSNLQSLKLEFVTGCNDASDLGCNFNFEPGDKFPSLHQLHLNNYDFNEHSFVSTDETRDRWHVLRQLIARYTGLQALQPVLRLSGSNKNPGGNLEKWKAAMNWTELEDLNLEFVDPVFFELMQGELPALQSLRLGPLLSCSSLGVNITNFLIQSEPLSQLSLHGSTGQVNLNQILDRHGGTLRGLEIRDWHRQKSRRPTLSSQDLEDVNQKCPLLSKLGIDITQNGTWPFNMLDSLAGYRQLTSLDVFIGPEVDARADTIYGYSESLLYRSRTDYDEELKLNATSALRFYKRLRSLKEGNELLHFKIGLGNAGLGYYYKGHRGEADMDMNTVAYECTVLDGNGQRKEEGVAWCEIVPTRQRPYYENDDVELTE